MKTTNHTVTYGFLVLLALSLAGCGQKDPAAAAGKSDSVGMQLAADRAEYYTCPMHPWVRSDRPGACPVCGMALVKKSAHARSPVDTAEFRGVSLSPTQRVLANITSIPAVRRALTTEINAVGIVAAAEPSQAIVAARFRGRLEKLYVNTTGQKVHRGEPLFDLYSPDLISAERDFLIALQAEQGSASAEITGTMQKKLLEASRDRLKIHFGLTDPQIARLETSGQISTAVTFFSPISGTVLQKDVQEGMYVDEGMTLYQLADLSMVWAYLDVYEKDLRAVKTGQAIGVTTEAYPEMTFNGRVTFIDPVVNPGTRTIRVRTEIPNKEGLLKPNMFIRAHVFATANSAVVVPQSAVLSTGPRTVVWVEVQPNQFEPRDVITGAADSGQVEILRGVCEGENVAQTGGFLIDSESALQQPGTANPHATHRAGVPIAQDNPASPSSGENRVKIVVDGEYAPDVVRVHRDLPITLEFFRKDGGACRSEVVFAELHLRRKLSEGKTTSIELPPQKPGEIHFTCGMGMLHGTVIVE